MAATLLLLSFTVFILTSTSIHAKLTHIHFYMHDNLLPPDQTVAMVTGTAGSSFGSIAIIDDAITEGLDQSSNTIGRGQGTWIVSAMDASSLLMTFSAVFHTGEFSGSTLSVHGADNVNQAVREIAVIGGTGVFRSATGYAVIKTAKFTPASVTLEFDITVSH